MNTDLIRVCPRNSVVKFPALCPENAQEVPFEKEAYVCLHVPFCPRRRDFNRRNRDNPGQTHNRQRLDPNSRIHLQRLQEEL